MVEPDFAGRLSGFTLVFVAMIQMLAQKILFTTIARIAGESSYRVIEVCERYVWIALSLADFSDLSAPAIDETSREEVVRRSGCRRPSLHPRLQGAGPEFGRSLRPPRLPCRCPRLRGCSPAPRCLHCPGGQRDRNPKGCST